METKYVYIRTEFSPYCLYTVGFYHNGKWNPESDYESKEEAAKRVSFLNGNSSLNTNDILVKALTTMKFLLECDINDFEAGLKESDNYADVRLRDVILPALKTLNI